MAGIDSHLRWLLGAMMIGYVIAMYGLAFWAKGRIRSSVDFLVAGRRLPLSLAWMTLLATWFGAGTMLTAADEVRQEGLQAAALDPLGAGMCLLLAGLFIAGPMWRMQLLTVPDLFRRRFGTRAEILAALIMVPGYFGWIAAQFVALAGMLELFFGIDPHLGVLLVAIVGTGYTLLGGMWSVTLTDAVQISFVLIGLIVLGSTVLDQLGHGSLSAGLMRLNVETPAQMRQILPHDDARMLMEWLTVLAVGALGNLPGQDLMQRVFAARSEAVAKRACYVAGGFYLTFGLIPIGLGLATRLLFPDAVDSRVLPSLAHAFLTPGLAVVFTLALLSAVLSTIDSAILSPAGVLAQNVVAKVSRAPLLRLNRWSVVVVAACSLAMAYAGEDAYSLLEGAYEIGLVGLFVPMMFGLFTIPRSGRAAFASMSAGISVWLVHEALGWEFFLPTVSMINVWQLPVSLTATLLSLLAYLVCEPPWRMQRTRGDA